MSGTSAAQRDVDARGMAEEECPSDALHAHFLRAGRQSLVVEWDVERVRDGRRFVTRRVVGRQAAATIFLLTASFTRAQEGLAHQDPMPTVLPPDGLPDWEDLRVRILGDPGARRPHGPLEVRECDPEAAVPAVGRAATRAP